MRRRTILICAIAVACPAGGQPARAHDGSAGVAEHAGAAGVELGTCDMSVALVRDTANRLRRFVPDRYRLGRSLYTLGLPGFGMAVLWTLHCDGIELPGAPPQQAVVRFAGVQVEAPGRPSSIATIANLFDIYAVAASSDNSHVASWLRAAGMPVSTTAGYGMRLTPLHPDPVGVHRHTNAFWHDGADGRTARLGLNIPQAEDVSCIELLWVCGVVNAGPGSPVAALLGARRRPVDFVFDHVGLRASTLTLEEHP